MTQTQTYGEYALNLGIIGVYDMNHLKATMSKPCKKQVKKGLRGDTCTQMFNNVLQLSGTADTGLVNQYDVRLFDSQNGATWPRQGLANERAYLNNAAVRRAIHSLSPSKWEWREVSADVSLALLDDQMESSIPQIVQLLADGVKLLMYNGQFDLVCNHYGTTMYLQAMKWPGKKRFARAKRFVWTVDGATAGYARYANNLTYVIVNGGSHMVPSTFYFVLAVYYHRLPDAHTHTHTHAHTTRIYLTTFIIVTSAVDKPAETLDMITRFVDGKSFKDAYVNMNNTRSDYDKHKILSVPAFGVAAIAIACLVLGALLLAIIRMVCKGANAFAYQPVPDAAAAGQA
jgi:hypothetical protein